MHKVVKLWSKAALLIAFLIVSHVAIAQDASDAVRQQMQVFLTSREALFDARGIDVPKFSQSINAVVREGEKLEREGNYQGALDQLLTLQRVMPLLEVPSYDVHMLSSWLYKKLANNELSQLHKVRADAYRQLLWSGLGKGDTQDDPLRVVMNSEIAEWAKSQLARIVDVKNIPYKGRDQMVVTYQGPSTGNQPRNFYAVIDARTNAQLTKKSDLFEPLAIASLRPQDAEKMRVAGEKRKRFLDDTQFPYLELKGTMDNLYKESTALASSGKFQEALSKLLEIEKIRPIEEIPTPGLLSLYSFLLGKAGNIAKQVEMRGLIFGVNQTIAHSGDGKSPETAVHVIFTNEEYEWLREKKLKPSRQALLNIGNEKFDKMTATDTEGNARDVYFNITRLYAKYAQMMDGPSKPAN